MARKYGKLLTGVADGTVPRLHADGRRVVSRMRCSMEILDLATVAVASGDTVPIAVLPEGCRFAGVRLTASATMGAATIAIGPAGSADAYRAAATFTAVDTPTTFGKASAMAADPVTVDTEILMTVTTAGLPGAGILTAELFYTGR